MRDAFDDSAENKIPHLLESLLCHLVIIYGHSHCKLVELIISVFHCLHIASAIAFCLQQPVRYQIRCWYSPPYIND
jgi:hypothetical protein